MQWVTLLSNISRVSSSTLVPRVIVWIFSCSPCLCGFHNGFLVAFNKNVSRGRIGYSKLPLGVNDHVNVCVYGTLQYIGIPTKVFSHLLQCSRDSPPDPVQS